VFPGCCLAGDATGLESGGAHASLLEGPVPMGSLDGFDVALNNLTKLAMRPERIAAEMAPRRPNLDADRGVSVNDRGVQFESP
jgi:hypothetical protein